MGDVRDEMFPVQKSRQFGRPHPTRIPWSVAELAYSQYHYSQTLERIAERGGFGPEEMTEYLPDWIEQCSEITQLRTERDEARADKDRLDWIAQPLNEFAFPVRDHSTGEWWIYHDDDDEFTVSAPTLREAIDKAGKVAVDAKQREER